MRYFQMAYSPSAQAGWTHCEVTEGSSGSSLDNQVSATSSLDDDIVSTLNVGGLSADVTSTYSSDPAGSTSIWLGKRLPAYTSSSTSS